MFLGNHDSYLRKPQQNLHHVDSGVITSVEAVLDWHACFHRDRFSQAHAGDVPIASKWLEPVKEKKNACRQLIQK